MKKNIIYILSIVFLAACQVKLDDFNPNQDATRMAVDALVSDSLGFHYIRLTKSVNVLSTEPNPPVNNALVVVSDNAGLVDTFALTGENGIYRPSKLWRAVPGNTYTLNISSPEFNATAIETMPLYPDFKIDSLTSVFREKAREEAVESFAYNDIFFDGKPYIKAEDSIYRVRMYAMENLPYRVNVQTQVFRNGVIFNGSNQFFVNNLKDVPINSFFVMPPPGGGPPRNIHFVKGDTVTVLLQGISDQCFVYYQGLNAVLSNDGGLFSSPAGNPPTNFNTDMAIGYFKVAKLTQKSVIVKFTGEVED